MEVKKGGTFSKITYNLDHLKIDSGVFKQTCLMFKLFSMNLAVKVANINQEKYINNKRMG